MPDALESGSVVAGHRIVRLIGRGATGAVYLAEGAAGSPVALKVLLPELAGDERFRERFLREAQIAGELDEPHIVPVLAAGEDGGRLWLGMPFVDGPDLRELLRRDGPLEPERAVGLVAQVASALDAAHAQGLVHRDVKPGNVIVVPGEQGEHAWLCDFGLAEHLASVDSLDGGRSLAGTLAYISPEQIEGAAIGARADVYSLGCLLFECLAGHAPFERESEVATVYAHMHEPPPLLSEERPGLPAGLDDVIAGALAKAPGDRHASCGELARAAASALRGEPARSSAGRRRRRALAAGALAALALAGTGVAAAILRSGGHASATAPRLAVAPKTMGLIDAVSRRVVGQIAFDSQPWDVVFDAHRAWVLLGDERSVARVDLATHRVLSTTALPFRPGGIATGAGRAWVTEDAGPRVVGIDAATGRITKRFSVRARGEHAASPTGIAFGAGSLWIARGAETVRVEPSGGNVLARILTPLAANSMVFAAGALWAASAETGRVVKIDPALNAVTASTALHATITDLAVGGGSVWVSIVPDDVVYRLSPDDGSVQATLAAGPWPSALSARDGLWIANAKGGRLVHVDSSGRREVVPLSGPPLVSRYHGGLLWTSVGAPEPAAPASGRTLRILLGQDVIGDADPATSDGPVFRQLAYATCPYLLDYPDVAGAAGRVLQPEVAAAQPVVSADGRTYTFRIRRGFRFSPPSGEAVTAETFKATIERALSPRLDSGRARLLAQLLLPDVVGATAYAAGRTAHIGGISAHGATLAIRLTRAAGDLPARLRSSYLCPVPVGTRTVSGGGTGTPIPMAGPYYVESTGGGQTVLERNPGYRGNRPRRSERIIYANGFTATAAIERLHDGRGDYLNGSTVDYDPSGPLAPGGELDAALGPGSRAGRAGAARYSATPIEQLDGLAFNTRRPLFRDVRMRRAVALALDRRALAAVYGSLPSDRLIPVAIAGSSRNIAYGNEPDVAAARSLAGLGARRTATLYGCGEPSNRRIAEIVRANLVEIGIDVRLDLSSSCLVAPEPKRLAAADLQLISHDDAAVDPASFVELPLGSTYSGPGYWRAPRLQAQIAAARALRGRARTAEYARLEQRLVRTAVPLTVYANGAMPELFSARVGCNVSQPALGFADLGALCLRA